MVRFSGSSLPCFRRELLAVPQQCPPKIAISTVFCCMGAEVYYLVTQHPIFSPSSFLHGLILSLHVFGREQIVKKKQKKVTSLFLGLCYIGRGAPNFPLSPLPVCLPFHLVFPWEDCVCQTHKKNPTFAVLSILITLLPGKLQLWRKWRHLFFSSEGDFASLDLEVL
jgi:hypothetical protein